MMTLTLASAIFSLLLGLAVIWSNPFRLSNRAFSFVLLLETAWLCCVYRAMGTTFLPLDEKLVELEWWFRANAMVVSFLPVSIWLLMDVIARNGDSGVGVIGAAFPSLSLGVFCALMSTSDRFVYPDAGGYLRRGEAYYIYMVICLLSCAITIINTWAIMAKCRGIRRLELQFIALNAGGAAVLMGILNGVGNYSNVRAFNKASVILVLAATAIAAWTLLFYRVFSAHDVFRQLIRKFSFVTVLSCGTYFIWTASSAIIAQPFGLLLGIGICGPLAVWVDRKSRSWLDADGERRLSAVRRLLLEIARAEWRPDRLVEQFEVFLRMEFGSHSCHLCLDNGDGESPTVLSIKKSGRAFLSLCELGWATPDGLSRRRNRPGFADLQHILDCEKIGLIVSVPRNSPTPSLIITLGKKRDDWPYTYPEAQHLQGIALVVDNLLNRSRMVTHASSRAKMNNMAMMSKGLAHDLRNLITPVSSFVAQSERRYSPGSPDADVHAAAWRSIGMVDRYLRDALLYTDDIEPRFEATDLAAICSDSREILAGRAHGRGVMILLNCAPMERLAMDGGLVRRLMINLIANGIDACAPGQFVEVECAAPNNGWVRIQVRDNGCGIPTENIARIFEPHFSTKQSGEGERGFGIGLSVCRKVVMLHGGSISVKSEVGRGTSFMIDLPTAQSGPSPRGMPEVV